MDVQDGFIVGIFNYCDSWCSACGFTSRCRVFADIAEAESALDPNLKPVVDAPPLPNEMPPPPPAWMQELLDDLNEPAQATGVEHDVRPAPRRPTLPAHDALRHHAKAYLDWAHAWLRTHPSFADARDPGDPRAAISWYHAMIHIKILRALRGLAEDDPSARDWPADCDGSAKVALLAIERSHEAWLQLIMRGMVMWLDGEPFVKQLLWLRDEIERVFPNARSFIRPGFDEPDDVARLLASEHSS